MLGIISLTISAILFISIFIITVLCAIFTFSKNSVDHKLVIKLCNIAEILIPFTVGFAIFGILSKNII